ncbi:hypothetical protein HNP81_002835 [Peribacillus huizhouensis]|uniref:Uncharacterized protein n=1 Tax=Peribacillus huizhouensis TaxID=1501239 RepID=A0ABR6CRF9_9BACI|nr:hypothetical protein [Peribacillus huizhouensis]
MKRRIPQKSALSAHVQLTTILTTVVLMLI